MLLNNVDMDFVKNINADRENTDAFTEKLWMGIQNGDKDCYEKLLMNIAIRCWLMA